MRGDLAAWLELALIPGLGDPARRRLLGALGTPRQVLAASPAALARVIGEEAARRMGGRRGEAAARVEEHLAWAERPGNHVLALGDPDFPQTLLSTADPPCVLFAKGRIELLRGDGIAIVGARAATPQGLANAEAFAAALSDAGLTVISGLALGIDAAAHAGGLRGASSTIAVIGTGADRIYPSRHQALARRIADEGLILSEFPLGTPAQRHNFPRRNRLISGLGLGVLVVEAALGSGSLITARLAGEQGREVFAIPGSIHSPLSRGCHRLIRDGAKLVESAADILEELDRRPAAAPVPDTPTAPEFAAEQARLLEALGFDPVDGDTLLQRSGLTADTLSAILLTMELDGRVARLPGGRVQRIP